MTSKDVQLSKSLSWLLRHGAKEANIEMSAEGFVSLDDILSAKQFRGVTRQDVERIVQTCKKQRFSITTDSGGALFIKANQGHTIEVQNLDLVPITAANLPAICIHGTYSATWPTIKRDGLSRMRRQHVHMAEAMPGMNQVISGMRSSCNVHIYVDIKRAIEDGLTFYKSVNNVILSPGNECGMIPVKYFTKAVRRVDGAVTQLDL